MHILYVDESGDDGFSGSGSFYPNTTPSGYYIRTGIAIHDLKWHSIHQCIENFRHKYKIPPDVELHASAIYSGRDRKYINHTSRYVLNWFGKNFPVRSKRKQIVLDLCKLVANIDLSIFYIIIDKARIKTSVLNYKELPKLRSWEFLIERYNLYLNNQEDTKGIIVSDAVTVSIESKHRDFAKAIYATSMHVQDIHFIESILFEPSESSNLLQLADICAFACGRKYNANDGSLFDILKAKIFSYNSTTVGYGLKIWPDQKTPTSVSAISLVQPAIEPTALK